MSEYGYRSYAGNLENRVITNNWTTQGFGLGRMYYTYIRDEDTRDIVGMQMRWKNNNCTNAWGRDGKWVFRAYLDGIGLYRPYVLGYRLRYPSQRHIKDVISKHYTLDQEVQDPENAGRYHVVMVYKRKLLSSFAKNLYRGQLSFGEFLTSKYNRQEVTV